MGLAVYGKHPAKGDFVEHGIPAPLRGQLEGWLDAVLADAKHSLGDRWEQVWAEARPLRFWIGAAVWGEPMCGVLIASADRVGRRFPLVIFATGDEAKSRPCPSVDADQGWYQALEAHLLRMQQVKGLTEPAALLLSAPRLDAAAAGDLAADFWAVRPGNEIEGLWGDVAMADHSRASLTRSYWWSKGEDPISELLVDGAESVEVAPPEPQMEAADVEPAEGEPQAEAGDDIQDEPFEHADDSAADVAAAGSAWDMPLAEDDDSPFAAASEGMSLFAAPEPVPEGGGEPFAVEPGPIMAAPQALPRWSQLWAAEGLPSGHVLAWFLRGYDDNQ